MVSQKSTVLLAVLSKYIFHCGFIDAVLNGKWTSDIAHNLNAGLLSEFFVLWRHIYTQSLQLDSAQEDEITWTLESSGEYSASSAYTIQFSDSMCTASDIGRRL